MRILLAVLGNRTLFTRLLVDCVELLVGADGDRDLVSSYDWCIEELRRHGYTETVHEVLLSKADALVAERHFAQAIQIYEAISSAREMAAYLYIFMFRMSREGLPTKNTPLQSALPICIA